MKPVIVHVSNDYPDPLQPNKTKAVAHLVDGTPEYRHVVYSLNRVNGWNGLSSLPFGADRTAIAYGALPKGLFWEKRLDEVAQWIIADLKAKKIVPDIVEAHKFTVEGLIGETLASAFGCPLICDIQGGSDVRILRAKIGSRSRYRALAAKAALIFPYAPWAIGPFQTMAGLNAEKCVILPVVPGIDNLSPSMPVANDRFISIFHLDSWKRKNLHGMITAVKRLIVQHPSMRLDVYGRGSPSTLIALRAMIDQAGMSKHIALKGAAANGSLPDIMKNYVALILPTFEETYGLVYAEALFAGLPLLFSKDRSIDGYFPASSIGYACDPASTDDIVRGMETLIDQESSLKNNIARMQKSGELDLMRKGPILDAYRRGLNRFLTTNTLRKNG